ncbi:hypothetical protein [Thermomonas carbonis]|uniref:Lipoprotein n=1 Tax=Thermomonas carbonis TaxID=1463158 RepID=A0A7G9SNK1_9GAMM|nr:hypothetical protein [Thermomonas carbonis]QNN69426.1 hypothetical protein H9L16_12175 [Thermomonas carbonis]GHC13050.1 hypothetical protein GCM10010080_30690 [Thermomonas carbonis]
MKKTHVVLALFLAASASACASQTVAQNSLQIKTGGGVTGPFIRLSLLSSGELSVTRESMPFADTKSGLTTIEFKEHLDPTETVRLFQLAQSATDFSQGCGLVGHGTDARLSLQLSQERIDFECDGAIRWPTGPLTKSLVDSLNQHLPKKFQVK